MSKVIKISDDLYPVDELIADLVKDSDTYKQLLCVLIDDKGGMQLCHSGMSVAELAIAVKLVDKELTEQIFAKINIIDESDNNV